MGAGSIFSRFWYGNSKILFVKTACTCTLRLIEHLYWCLEPVHEFFRVFSIGFKTPQIEFFVRTPFWWYQTWNEFLLSKRCSPVASDSFRWNNGAWRAFLNVLGFFLCVLSFFRWVFCANPLNGRFSEPKKNSCGLNFGSRKNPKSALRSEKSGVYFDHNRFWLETDVDGLYANYRHRRHNASSFLAHFWGVCERNLMIFLAFIMFSSAPDAMSLVRKLSDLYLFWENVFFVVFRGFSWFQAFLCPTWALNSHQTMARPPGLYINNKKYIRTKFWQHFGALTLTLKYILSPAAGQHTVMIHASKWRPPPPKPMCCLTGTVGAPSDELAWNVRFPPCLCPSNATQTCTLAPV